MLRRIVSLTSLTSFLALVATAAVLYIQPHGRVAYWSDWTFLWMSKPRWDAMHLSLGVLFLASSILHIFLNWRPLLAYMRDKAKKLVVFTAPMIAACVLTIYAAAGLPPMDRIVAFMDSIKDAKAEVYGNPPYGHAELSTLGLFCKRMGFDYGTAAEALKQAGYDGVSPDVTLLELAKKKDVTPKDVFEAIRSASGQGASLPDQPPPGYGRTKLSVFCRDHGLDLQAAMDELRTAGFTAGPDVSIKDIAATSGQRPLVVYQILRSQAEGKTSE